MWCRKACLATSQQSTCDPNAQPDASIKAHACVCVCASQGPTSAPGKGRGKGRTVKKAGKQADKAPKGGKKATAAAAAAAEVEVAAKQQEEPAEPEDDDVPMLSSQDMTLPRWVAGVVQ